MRRALLLISALLLFSSVAHGQVVIDAVGSAHTNGSSTCTVSIAVTSGATGLAGGMARGTPRTVTSVVWDPGGADQSLSSFISVDGTNAGFHISADIFTVASPSPGTHNLVFTLSSSTGDAVCSAVSVLGGDTGTVMYNSASNDNGGGGTASVTLSLSGTVNDYAFATFSYCCTAGVTPDGEIDTGTAFDHTGTTSNHGAGGLQPGASSLTMDWVENAGDTFIIVGGMFKSGSAPASSAKPNRLTLMGAGRP